MLIHHSFDNAFLIPLAKNINGIAILDNIWKYIYGSNEEKTDKFNVKFVKSVLFLLVNNKKYEDYIIMAKVPIEFKDRCSISMKCDNILYEYVYIINGNRSDAINIDYIHNSDLSQISKYLINNFELKKFIN